MKTYHKAMNALGDPTRRAVFESLKAGPRAVGEIARHLPVSRPAVSQHLRTLKQAGLVKDRGDGARRLYEVDPKGLAELRSYVDGLWDEALANFKAVAEADQEGRKRWTKQRSPRSSRR